MIGENKNQGNSNRKVIANEGSKYVNQIMNHLLENHQVKHKK